MKNQVNKNTKSVESSRKPHNGKSKTQNMGAGKIEAKFTEFTVKIRIKQELLERFSDMSDCLGLTRDQAVSGMLESNMEADHDLNVADVQSFVVRAAAKLFLERKSLLLLERAYNNAEFGERRLETAKGVAMSELFDLAQDEMGLTAFSRTKMALIRETKRKS
jgi:predicted DNA-binding protein